MLVDQECYEIQPTNEDGQRIQWSKFECNNQNEDVSYKKYINYI